MGYLPAVFDMECCPKPFVPEYFLSLQACLLYPEFRNFRRVHCVEVGWVKADAGIFCRKCLQLHLYYIFLFYLIAVLV